MSIQASQPISNYTPNNSLSSYAIPQIATIGAQSLSQTSYAQQSQTLSLSMNKDAKMLSNLQKVFDTYIQDCIRLTDWTIPEQANKHKQILHRRIVKTTEQFFNKMSSPEINIQPIQDSIYLKVKQENNAPNNLNSGEPISFKSDYQERKSGDSDSTRENDEQEQRRRDNFHNEDISNARRELRKRKRRLNQSYSEDEYNLDDSQNSEDMRGEEGEGEEGDSFSNTMRNKFRRIPNPDSKYQCSDFRREQFPDVGYSRSISNYPITEKRRVIDFFNAHYDPAKRNKIEIIQQIVQNLHYSYSSVYYLVSNQGPNNKDQYSYSESLNLSQSMQGNQTPIQYEQYSLSNSIQNTYSVQNKQKSSANPPAKPRYQNKGCYMKPGRPPKNPLLRRYKQDLFEQDNNNIRQEIEQNDNAKRSKGRGDICMNDQIEEEEKIFNESDEVESKTSYADTELFQE